MGLRETLNEKPAIGYAVGVGFALIAVVAAYASLSDGGGGGSSSDEAFFTVDDGATWFEDAAHKVPPFDHGGKPAVRAYVFEAGGKKFVNHLERYTPEGKKAAEARAEALKSGKAPPAFALSPGATIVEIKRPGSKAWVSQSDKAKAGPILQVKAPGGGTATPVEP